MAAITGAFAGSRLGVTGTAIGAGIVSAISSIGAVVYEYWLERTGRSVLSRLPVSRRLAGWPTTRAGGSGGAGLHPQHRPQPIRALIGLSGVMRRRAALVIGLPVSVFVLALAVVTGAEVLRGGPLSGGDSGTTVGSLFGQPITATSSHGHGSTTAPAGPSHRRAVACRAGEPGGDRPGQRHPHGGQADHRRRGVHPAGRAARPGRSVRRARHHRPVLVDVRTSPPSMPQAQW